MKRDILLIVLGTVAVRVAVVALFGIRDSSDTLLYIEGAAGWRDSGAGLLSLFASSQGRSPLVVALIAGLQSRFENWRVLVVAIQTLASIAVPVALYLAARRGGMSRTGAWAAAMLAIASYELSRWNAYVLTDALFIVCSGAAMCATIVALSTRSVAWGLATVILVIGALLVRPTGPAVALAVALAACLVRPPARAVIGISVATVLAVVAFESFIVRSEARRKLAIHACIQLIEGRVTFGTASFEVARLADASVPEGTSMAACLVRVAIDHPGHVLNVMTRRAIVYWLPVYPNYSTRHNFANVVLLGVPLVLAGVGLFSGGRAFRDDVVRVVGASFVIAFGLFHTATWSEGDHRFLAPVLPAVYLLAGRAIDRFLRMPI